MTMPCTPPKRMPRRCFTSRLRAGADRARDGFVLCSCFHGSSACRIGFPWGPRARFRFLSPIPCPSTTKRTPRARIYCGGGFHTRFREGRCVGYGQLQRERLRRDVRECGADWDGVTAGSVPGGITVRLPHWPLTWRSSRRMAHCSMRASVGLNTLRMPSTSVLRNV